LVPVDRVKQKCFQITTKQVRRSSSFSSVGSLFHARGAATEKALSPIRRGVRGTTRLPHDEARSIDRPGILATDVRRSEIYSGVCPRSEYPLHLGRRPEVFVYAGNKSKENIITKGRS